MSESRLYNSIRNSGMSLLAQIVSIVLNFIGRTFFIKLLNIDYLGVNGLFTNILTLLSLAELGVGTAITYMMYEPIAKGNIPKIAAFNNLFRKIYNTIGCVVLVLGLCIAPFLKFFIKDIPEINENIYIIYILFLLNTVVSYFFTYKRSLIIAHQKEYINSRNVLLFTIIKDVVLIIVLVVTSNYYLYLFSQIIITFLSNLSISRKADKLFPEIVENKTEKITKEEGKTIVKNTFGMVCHKIGSVVVSGTDNILISSFVGLSSVGIFSNYKLIQSVCRQLISQAVNSVTASFGNLIVTDEIERVYSTFKNIYFLNFTLAYFVSLLFFSLIDSFITIWIGNVYLLPRFATFIISFNLYLNQIRIPSQILINTYGVFWEVKWKSIVEAIINLIASCSLVIYCNMGVTGILLGTLISNLLTNIWWEPYAAYKYGLNLPIFDYVKMFIKDILVLGLSFFLAYILSNYIKSLVDNLLCVFLLKFVSTTLFSVLLYVIFYHRTNQFRYMLNVVFGFLKKSRG